MNNVYRFLYQNGDALADIPIYYFKHGMDSIDITVMFFYLFIAVLGNLFPLFFVGEIIGNFLPHIINAVKAD